MQVVVLYSIEDGEKVGTLVEELSKRGIAVRWDKSLPAGASWDLEIRKLIRDERTDHVIVCISQKVVGAKRKQFRSELKELIEENARRHESARFVVVARLDDVEVARVSNDLVELRTEPFDLRASDIRAAARRLGERLENPETDPPMPNEPDPSPLPPKMLLARREADCAILIGFIGVVASIATHVVMTEQITSLPMHALQVTWTALLLIGCAFVGYGMSILVSAYFESMRTLCRILVTTLVVTFSWKIYSSKNHEYREIVDLERARVTLKQYQDFPSVKNIVDQFPNWADNTRANIELLKVQQFLVWVTIAVVETSKRDQLGIEDGWKRLQAIGTEIGAQAQQIADIEPFYRSYWMRK